MDAIELTLIFNSSNINLITALLNSEVIGDALSIQKNCRMCRKDKRAHMRKVFRPMLAVE